MERVLTVTKDYVCFTEDEAANLIEEKRASVSLLNYKVIYKKETKKKKEHWIVTIKENIADADYYVAYEGE